MRWLLDQGLPRSTAAFLQQASHDAVHVGEIGMAAAVDAAILDLLARTFPKQLENGCLMTFSNGKVRYRDLPIT